MSGSSAGAKRKRVVLSIATKLQIVERAEKGESIAKLSSEFNIGNQTVRDIVRKKDELYKFVTSSDAFNWTSARKTTKGSKFDDLDRAVFEWFKQKRAEGCPVSGPLLLEKAKWFHCEMKIPEPFAASHGWLQCFKSRHGIRQLDIQGEKLSGDSDAAALYVTEFKRLVEAHDLSPDQLYNADESGLYWKALPSKMLVSKEEKSAPGHKSSKERITVLACANASGSHKLKLVCIGKSKNPRSFKGTQMRNFPVLYYNQTKAWMNREIFKDWFFKHFVPAVRDHLRSKNLPQRAVLLLDNAPSHPSENVLKTSDDQIFVAYLPPNVTSLKQPMDQGVLEAFKRRYRKSLLRSVLEEDGDFCDVENVNDSESQEITAASLLEEIQNVNGFEDVNRENIKEWLLSDNDQPGYQVKDDDALAAEAKSSAELPEESDNDAVEDEPSEKKVSIAEALNCAETLLDFLEQEADSSFSDILTLHKRRMSIKLKRCKNTKQRLLSDFVKKTSQTTQER
ncbi:jerky protein homolog-like [Erpetoichthys calabaricus]|uniref:jerky protein homolog-like n=1 Tax=Erpetoichthys calabaricus TaxID=27687 RepID=UPI0010A00069|nr:jerky protein homolog-like [Erpetoichthys calabaricus]